PVIVLRRASLRTDGDGRRRVGRRVPALPAQDQYGSLITRVRLGVTPSPWPAPREGEGTRAVPLRTIGGLGTPRWAYDPSVADERTQRTAQHYPARARGFDEHWAPLLRAMSRRVLPALPLRTAGAVLDVGTGTGGMLPPLRAAAPSAALFGVDVAEGMLALAAEKGVGAHLVMGDAHALPLLSACADVVLLAFVLHRVADPAQALAETA